VSLLRGLSNPLRVKLLYGLTRGTTTDQLRRNLGLTVPELDYHIRALETYGLITSKGTHFALAPEGVWLVNFLEKVSEKLTTGEEIETPFRCWQCERANLGATLYPDHFKLWCPSCSGGENRREILVTGQFPPRTSRTRGDFLGLIPSGIRLEIDVLRSMLERGVCRECGGALSIRDSDGRFKAICPFCGEEYQGPSGKQLDDWVQRILSELR